MPGVDRTLEELKRNIQLTKEKLYAYEKIGTVEEFREVKEIVDSLREKNIIPEVAAGMEENRNKQIKVIDLLNIFNGPQFDIYCERPETCYGYETIHNSEWIIGVPQKIKESIVVSCKVEDGTLCIKINACDEEMN